MKIEIKPNGSNYELHVNGVYRTTLSSHQEAYNAKRSIERYEIQKKEWAEELKRRTQPKPQLRPDGIKDFLGAYHD